MDIRVHGLYVVLFDLVRYAQKEVDNSHSYTTQARVEG